MTLCGRSTATLDFLPQLNPGASLFGFKMFSNPGAIKWLYLRCSIDGFVVRIAFVMTFISLPKSCISFSVALSLTSTDLKIN
jgi:hypothetical protein